MHGSDEQQRESFSPFLKAIDTARQSQAAAEGPKKGTQAPH
jgi:hypothetical protein